MPEDFEKVGESFIKKLEELGEGLKTEIKNVDKKIDDVQKKSTLIENRMESMNKEDKENEDELDPLSGPEEIAKSVEEKVSNKIEAKLRQEGEFTRECQKWDSLAFKKFPKLHDPASPFSKAVEEELKNAYPIGVDSRGKKILAPDAVLNAASRVAADLASKGQLEVVTHEELEPGGNFERKIKGKGISEIQREIAGYYKSYGINEKRLEERIKSRNAR